MAKLLAEWLCKGHRIQWVNSPEKLCKGDFLFLLGCGQLIRPSVLALHRNNLVIHESDLPEGKGWSPMTWQVLEGANRVPVTLLEAVERVDSGQIYSQEWIELSGTEFVDELRSAQAEKTLRLCRWFVESYPHSIEAAKDQQGVESLYPRRRAEDSRLDSQQTLADLFNLLRVVDNGRYPAFFDYRGVRVRIRVDKVPLC